MRRMTARAPSEGPAESEADRALVRRGRLVALVVAGTMVLWLGLQGLGGALGLPAAWMFVADLAALGAFAWALSATYGIWRRRQETKGQETKG